jgi:hypothetical protein
MTAIRRPGSPWRLLAHTWTGKKKGAGGPRYGDSWHVDNEAGVPDRQELIDGGVFDGGMYRSHEYHFPGTEFDELVVGRWLHVEQKTGRRWWMNVGNVTVWVTVRRDGTPKHVVIYGPHDYAGGPADRCDYECNWTGSPDEDGPIRPQNVGGAGGSS